jgi:hypothetical protein
MKHPPVNENATVQRKWQRDFRLWGKRRFILWFGVIAFGGWMFVIMTAFDFVVHHRLDYFFVALSLAIWAFAGYGFGRTLWSLYYDSETNGK